MRLKLSFRKYLAVLLMMAATQAASAQQQGLVQYVNALQGTNSSPGYSTGNIFPAVALPFGMHFWSPQTGKNGDGWKYRYDVTTIRGFEQTHQCSPWMNDYAVFSLMPVTGKLTVQEDERASTFRHSNEKARPDYYKVKFDNGITSEITPTERGAGFRFSFPKSGKAFIVFDGYTGMSDVKIDTKNNKITGYVSNGLFIPHNFKDYFVITFNKRFVAHGSWDGNDGSIQTGADSVSGRKKGIYLEFEKGATVEAKATSSYISSGQAETCYDRELGQSSFDQIRSKATAIWNTTLGRILVEGGTKEQMATFYSCLYRANLFPCKFYELDKSDQPYYFSPNDGQIHRGYFYTDEGYWDTFRAQFPLSNILYPEMQGRYMNAILAVKQQCGWLPSWSFPGETGGVMIGNHAISLLADAWAKGIHTFDPDSALNYYFHEATGSAPDGRFGRKDWRDYFTLGYIPYPEAGVAATAKTLEYCYDDFCAYQLAKMTNNTFYENIFARQLYNYKNVFNPATGFMEGRNAKGEWDKHFNPYAWGGAFVEGNSWHYTWSVFHDIRGLIDLTGGDAAFIRKADFVFTVSDSVDVGTYRDTIHEMREMVAAKLGQYAQGNEPIEHLIYLYTYAGQPWKTQMRIREVMDKLYNATPDGYPGDEDEGQMSSWYVLSALGIYSVCPGTDQYVIGSPVFEKATIALESGKKFVIKAIGNNRQNVYIQSGALNGKAFTKNWLSYNDIVNGGVLEFTMSDRPSLQRGTGVDDRPYSLSDSL